MIIILAIIVILFINKLTFNIRIDVIVDEFEDNYNFIIYYWSFKHKQRRSIVL